MADGPIDQSDQVHKDLSYSPASETETAAKQHTPDRSRATDDVDAEAVETLPGTGGPDDVGAVHVDETDLHMPRDTGAH